MPIGSDPETALDAEWASVAAPDATILVASCNADDGFVSGYEIALNNLLNGGTLPADSLENALNALSTIGGVGGSVAVTQTVTDVEATIREFGMQQE